MTVTMDACDVFEGYFDAFDRSQSIFLVWHVAQSKVEMTTNHELFAPSQECNETESTPLLQ
jgi:hypothetical protein